MSDTSAVEAKCDKCGKYIKIGESYYHYGATMMYKAHYICLREDEGGGVVIMVNNLMEKSIIYKCPHCLEQMIAYSLKRKYLYSWHCESCGYKGQVAHALLREKPDCIHWNNGFCSKLDFFRNHPKCMYYGGIEDRCDGCERPKYHTEDINK